ncbi:MAG: hypothetical protein NC225_11985 [Clostridium sp.]|nr:hypothetical protein [Clostridium sp.]MCM1460944.1 hypothetical protein [Bacteroides sp.]
MGKKDNYNEMNENEQTKKEKKKKKRKFPWLFFLLLVLIIAALLFFGKGGGFGFFNSGDKGTEKNTEADATEDEKTITIEVKQGQYFIDDKEVTLTDIEQIINENDAAHTKYVMDDNYAGTQSWDELKALFSNHGITPVMEE